MALLQALLSGLAVGGAYALVALGFSITFTTTKTLNFSQGEFLVGGAFIGMSASAGPGAGKPSTRPPSAASRRPGCWRHVLALLAALAVMGVLGWLLYVIGGAALRRGEPGWPGS